MSRDPIVEEVRRIRRQIEAECDNDPQKLYDHMIDVQRKYKDRLVSRAPKRLKEEAKR
jgi:hypothetical protein